ncbi:MAG TPA: family 16 glycosylhydrolase, partial [Phenylobacterium sp.]
MPPPSQFAAYINTQQTIFSEDFRATQFNYRDPFDQASTGLWRADYGHGGQQGLASYTLNDEKQLYVSSYFRDMDMPINPFSMDGESLTITARKRAPDDGLDAAFTINGVEYQYSSGAITTAPSENGSQGSLFEYGYFEMRAQLPTAAGAFPAFWLLPTENHGTDPNHPPEIDIMEQIGNKQAYWGTVHPGVDHPHTGNNQPMIDPSSGYATSGEIVTNGLPDLSGWHTYGLLWTPEKLVWTFDGVSKFEAPTPSLFDSPMYILANLALGGWGGAVNDAQLPASMNIDYIKVWDYAPKDPAGMTLKADSFRHSLAGYTGADTLVGGLGQDSMTGGAGADVFRFDLAPLQAANIGDFAAAEDKIDLRAALARDGYFGADPLLDQRVLVSTANGVTTVSY